MRQIKKPSKELIVLVVSAIIIIGVIATWPYLATQRQEEILRHQQLLLKRQAENNHTFVMILQGINDIKTLLNNTTNINN